MAQGFRQDSIWICFVTGFSPFRIPLARRLLGQLSLSGWFCKVHRSRDWLWNHEAWYTHVKLVTWQTSVDTHKSADCKRDDPEEDDNNNYTADDQIIGIHKKGLKRMLVYMYVLDLQEWWTGMQCGTLQETEDKWMKVKKRKHNQFGLIPTGMKERKDSHIWEANSRIWTEVPFTLSFHFDLWGMLLEVFLGSWTQARS